MGKSKGEGATWERKIKLTFYEIYLEEIQTRNNPTTHFKKEDWLNIIKKFKEHTWIKEYDRSQMKSKLDGLKKD